MSYYGQYPTGTPGYPSQPMGPSEPLAVELRFGRVQVQRRWTVLLRVILLIPQGIVLYLLSIAAFVVLFISWFGALFTGRLPEWGRQFLGGYLRWLARVTAYGMLLTDEYPPFSLDPAGSYPIDIAFPPADRLNRWSVFFRYLLFLPAGLLTNFLTAGMSVILIYGWFAALFTGRLPHSIFKGGSAVLRFSTRTNSFLYMLTSRYPDALYGEEDHGLVTGGVPPYSAYAPPPVPPVNSWTPPSPPVAGVPYPPTPTPWAAPPSSPATGWGPGPPPMPPPVPSWPQPGSVPPQPQGPPPVPTWYQAHATARADDPAAAGSDWRLSLASGGRGVVTTALVLGIVLYVLYSFVIIPAVVRAVDSPSVKLTVAYNTLSSSVQQDATDACPDSPNPLTCYQQGDQAAAGAFDQFTTTLQTIDFPAGSVGNAQRVEQDSTQLANDFSSLAQATGSIDEYQTAQQSSTLVSDLRTFQTDFNTLQYGLSF